MTILTTVEKVIAQLHFFTIIIVITAFKLSKGLVVVGVHVYACMYMYM